MLITASVTSCAIDDWVQDRDPNTISENQLLAGTSWWVEDIGGKGVIDMSHTTIEFTDDGRVVGDTGCNRYFGGIEISATEITVGALAGTRKACARSLMDQEMSFYQAMENVTQWEIAETGLLNLRDAEGKSQVRASKTEQ